jgi:PAS domain S-box-containing protein
MLMNVEINSFANLLTESSIVAMIVLGRDGEIITWNRAAAYLFEYAKDNAIGKQLHMVLPSVSEDHCYSTAIQLANEGLQSFLPAENEIPHRRHVETHFIPLKSDDSNVGVMLLIHDVSHRILKEEELQRLNNELHDRLRQLKLASRELSHLTHLATFNLLEPVRGIYSSIEKLIHTEAQGLSNNGKATFRRIQSSLNRMNLLLDDMITMSQINILERPENMVSLSEVLEEVRIHFAEKLEENNIKFTFGELYQIRAHKNQLVLLLQQILGNVIKYSGTANATIDISCTKMSIEDGDRLKRSGSYCVMTIRHNTPGFLDINPYTAFDEIETSTDPRRKSMAKLLPSDQKLLKRIMVF